MVICPENISNNISVDKNKCIFCLECVDKCTLDNLRFFESPCRQACPLNLNCQGYTQLIKRGEEEKALSVITESLPFPGILGRICTSPCETVCSRIKFDGQSVAVKSLKRYLFDKHSSKYDYLENLKKKWYPEFESTFRVAIVGGGPTGMLAALDLRKKGYQVVIFEASSKLGGNLTSCIPNFRLPKEIVEKELEIIEGCGIKVQYNTVVQSNKLSDLEKEFDAILIATGASYEDCLGINGEDATGVFRGIDFLEEVKYAGDFPIGKKVVVIGGGRVALDAAKTAYRLGANETRIVCLEMRDEMPVSESELEDILTEGIIVENGWGPKRISTLADESYGVEFKYCISVWDDSENFSPKFDETKTAIFDADTVIIAIGQKKGQNNLNKIGVSIKCNQSLQTNHAKIFMAGDVVTGPNSVIEAMAQGRRAAESMHRLLQGIPLTFGREENNSVQTKREIDFSNAVLRQKVKPGKPGLGYKNISAEIEQGIKQSEAVLESERCLSCGLPYGKHRTCWFCLPCEVECPEKAISVEVPYLLR